MKYNIEVEKNIEGQRVKVRIKCNGTGRPIHVSFTNESITKTFILQLRSRNFENELNRIIDMIIRRLYK